MQLQQCKAFCTKSQNVYFVVDSVHERTPELLPAVHVGRRNILKRAIGSALCSLSQWSFISSSCCSVVRRTNTPAEPFSLFPSYFTMARTLICILANKPELIKRTLYTLSMYVFKMLLRAAYSVCLGVRQMMFDL